MRSNSRIALITSILLFCLISPERSYSRETSPNEKTGSRLDSTTNPAHTTALKANSTIVPVKCYGGSASVTVGATGGLAPYTGTATLNLPAGDYSFTITDADGCSVIIKVTVSQPLAALQANSTVSNALCFDGTGSVLVVPTGGTSPYRGGGNFDKLTSGTYTFMILDRNDCPATATATIRKPTRLLLNSSVVNALCNATGSVAITAAGGTAPYKGTENFAGLGAGSYSFTVSDANGCLNTIQASVTASYPTATSSTSNVSICSGKLPYFWNNTTFSKAGNYSVVLRKSSGCDSIANLSLTILSATFSAPQEVSISASSLPYKWNGSVYLAAGTFSRTFVSASGCDSIASLTLTVVPVAPQAPSSSASGLQILVPKSWYPNTAGVNNRLTPVLLKVRQLNYFRIYDNLGKMMFETRDFGAGWDGKLNGVDMPMNVYAWVIEVVGTNGKITKENGTSNLIRNKMYKIILR